jgi:protein SCO1/2
MSNLNLDEPPRVGGSFNLTDHYGRAVSSEGFRGRFMLIFFGFTHCRVVCPRALTRISAALDKLGETSAAISALYITVDPERDTPEVMRKFLLPYPRILGLTGSRTEIDEVKRNFRIFARRTADPANAHEYDVPHTAITYLLDIDGKFIADFNDSIALDEMVERLKGHLSLPVVQDAGRPENQVAGERETRALG